MRLLGLWALWLSIYLGQYFAGEWYYAFPNLYNSLLTFTIMACVLSAYRTLWAYLYSFTAVVQIALNLTDAISPIEPISFNLAADYLNLLEALILFGIAGIQGLIGYGANWIDRGRSGRRSVVNR